LRVLTATQFQLEDPRCSLNFETGDKNWCGVVLRLTFVCLPSDLSKRRAEKIASAIIKLSARRREEAKQQNELAILQGQNFFKTFKKMKA